MQSTSRSVSQKSHLVPRILSRKFASGTRGSRGHGWLNKYRQGLGGRHLQGRYHNRDVNKRQSINDQVFGMNVNKQLAFLDLKVDDHKETKRVTIELASEALPHTCRNFVSLCSSSGGSQDEVEGTLSYQNTKVFKIEPKVGICMGDVTGGNDGLQGSCHPSTVTSKEAQGNPHTFEHESTVLSHCSKGMVSMLSTGMDKNDSRFMITTVDDAPHLDGKYVAFGRVQEGLDVLEDLVKGVYTKKGRPTVDIEVVNCGVVS